MEPALHPFTPPPLIEGNEDARKEWYRVVELLPSLVALDLSALEMYCASYARWIEAERIIEKEGLTIQNKYTTITHPAANAASRSSTECHRWARELGLTPKSREVRERRGRSSGTPTPPAGLE